LSCLGASLAMGCRRAAHRGQVTRRARVLARNRGRPRGLPDSVRPAGKGESRPYFSGLISSLLLLFSTPSSRPLTLSRYCSGTLLALSYLCVSMPSWTWISLTLVLPSLTVPVTVMISEPSWWRVVKRSPLRKVVVITLLPPPKALGMFGIGSAGGTSWAG